MNLQELKTKEQDLENEKDSKIKLLRKEYVILNDPYKIGDVIKDHHQTGRIISKKYNLGAQPCCVYYCHKLTKKGEINKTNPVCYIYQSNIKQQNND
tara:strand:- start:222 stop:512 length:291 start_codon:yes stop_codon:yes gene_type:complete